MWEAYYTDDRVFHSLNHTWASLPDEGVLLVVEYDKVGRRRIVDGGDWYWMEDGRVNYVPSVAWGRDEPRPDAPCQSCVKRGAGLPDAEYYALYNRVKSQSAYRIADDL